MSTVGCVTCTTQCVHHMLLTQLHTRVIACITVGKGEQTHVPHNPVVSRRPLRRGMKMHVVKKKRTTERTKRKIHKT